MSSINWFISAFKKYFDLTGRARRKEYWYFIALNLLTIIALCALESASNIMQIEITAQVHIGLLSGIYLLVILCPTLAVTTRRLHDTGRSGWWQLLYLLPILGVFIILVYASEDSKPGPNQYGKNPRGKCIMMG